MQNDEEYMDSEQKQFDGAPVGSEKRGICPVTYELMKHPWLDENMAKRIVKENQADDPEFYRFLEDESFGEFAEEVIDETMNRVSKPAKKGPSITISIGME